MAGLAQGDWVSTYALRGFSVFKLFWSGKVSASPSHSMAAKLTHPGSLSRLAKKVEGSAYFIISPLGDL